MTITHDTPITTTRLFSLWVELTGKCQLECLHCYAGSSPDGTHGSMTVEAWETVLTDAAGLGARMVCFIGGEPTLHPDLPRLVRHALALGMGVEVFSNLVRVTSQLWELFGTPGVRLATSWYSSDRLEHKRITGRDSWRQTLGNIEEAVRRGIPLRVGVIDGIVPGQRFEEGNEMLRERGVTDIGGDHLREFGRGKTPDPSQACGNCGNHRLAVLPDGKVTPCPLTRWMNAGDVRDAPLGELAALTSEQAAAVIPNWRGVGGCEPGEDCNPYFCQPDDKCWPDACAPIKSRGLTADCKPNFLCKPDYCAPTRSAETSTLTRSESCRPDDPKCWPECCQPVKTANSCNPGDATCWPDRKPCQPRPPEAQDDLTAITITDCGPAEPCNPDCLPSCLPGASCRPDRVAVMVVDGCLPEICGPDVPCNPDYKCTPDVTLVPGNHDRSPNYRDASKLVQGRIPCSPDSDCRPDLCHPDWAQSREDVIEVGVRVSQPPCMPDHFCNPTCSPGACKPNIECKPETPCVPDAG